MCLGTDRSSRIPLSKKINRRRGKLASRFSELSDAGLLHFSTPINSSAIEAFSEVIKAKISPSAETWPAWLKYWFDRCIKGQLQENNETIETLVTAYYLARDSRLLESLNDPILQRRMEKFAQYVKTVVRVITLASKEKGNTQFVFETVRLFFYSRLQGIY